jgi:chromosome segregation ATPase
MALTHAQDSADQKKHISYMNLLNAKSEEIGDLTKQLQDERSQKEELASKVAALEKQLRLAQISSADSQRAATDDLVQKLEASNVKLATAEATLEAEREAWSQHQRVLQNQIDGIRGQNDNVMTMFREANGRAEGLFKEKKELNKELEIAQKQAKEAVVAQKAFFAKKLELMGTRRDEVQRTASLLMQRDDRSKKHHHKRQYAAEVDELRGRLRSVKVKNLDLTNQLRKAKKSNAALKLQLNGQWHQPDSGTDRDGSGSPEGSQDGRSPSPEDGLSDNDDVPRSQPMVQDEQEDEGESSEEDPEDEVVRCTWRKEDNKMCNALFKTQAVSVA